jgi:hypothetical protein
MPIRWTRSLSSSLARMRALWGARRTVQDTPTYPQDEPLSRIRRQWVLLDLIPGRGIWTRSLTVPNRLDWILRVVTGCRARCHGASGSKVNLRAMDGSVSRVRKASTMPRQRLRRSVVGLLDGLRAFARQSSSPRAKWIARSIALSRAELRTTRRSRSKLLGTVVIVSRFAAQSRGRPSSRPNGTSTGMPRVLVVTGATITSSLTA